ncbi:MAG: hypothetical protein MJ252_00690, partial [archaeon]|nr:hypothetical protein [archaeon]
MSDNNKVKRLKTEAPLKITKIEAMSPKKYSGNTKTPTNKINIKSIQKEIKEEKEKEKEDSKKKEKEG